MLHLKRVIEVVNYELISVLKVKIMLKRVKVSKKKRENEMFYDLQETSCIT